jgi:hypothetical protein
LKNKVAIEIDDNEPKLKNGEINKSIEKVGQVLNGKAAPVNNSGAPL